MASHRLRGNALHSAIAPQPGVVLGCLKLRAPHLTTSSILSSSSKTSPRTGCWTHRAPGSGEVQRGSKVCSGAGQQDPRLQTHFSPGDGTHRRTARR